MIHEVLVIDDKGQIKLHIDLTREEKRYLSRNPKMLTELFKTIKLIGKELAKKELKKAILNELAISFREINGLTIVVVADRDTEVDMDYISSLLKEEISKGQEALPRARLKELAEKIHTHHVPSTKNLIWKVSEALRMCQKDKLEKTNIIPCPIQLFDFTIGRDINDITMEEAGLDDFMTPDIFFNPHELIPKAVYILKKSRDDVEKAFAILSIFKVWEYELPLEYKIKLADIAGSINSITDPILREILLTKLESYSSVLKFLKEDELSREIQKILLDLREKVKGGEKHIYFLEAYLNDLYYRIPLPNPAIEGDKELRRYFNLLRSFRNSIKADPIGSLTTTMGTLISVFEKFNAGKIHNNLYVFYLNILADILPIIYSFKEEDFGLELEEVVADRIVKRQLENFTKITSVDFKQKFDSITRILASYALHSIEHKHPREDLETILSVTNEVLRQYNEGRPNILLKQPYDISFMVTLISTKGLLEKLLGKGLEIFNTSALIEPLELLSQIADSPNPRIGVRALQLLLAIATIAELYCSNKGIIFGVFEDLEKIASMRKLTDFAYFVLTATTRQLRVMANVLG